MTSIQPIASKERKNISSDLRIKAKPRTKVIPLSTVSSAAVGAGTLWVPTLTRMLPLAKPQAARKAKATASGNIPPGSPVAASVYSSRLRAGNKSQNG